MAQTPCCSLLPALDPNLLSDLQQEAAAIGLECLVEVHTQDEMSRLTGITFGFSVSTTGSLTFQVDIGLTERLLPGVPDDVLVVSESGLSGPEEILRLQRSGVDAFLIGEAL